VKHSHITWRTSSESSIFILRVICYRLQCICPIAPTACITILNNNNAISDSRLCLWVSCVYCAVEIECWKKFIVPSMTMPNGHCINTTLVSSPDNHLWLEWRFLACIGNNGTMHFNAYPEPYSRAHSVTVYFLTNLGTRAVSTGAIAHYICTTFLKTEIINK